MQILKIEKEIETDNYYFIFITFKKWFGRNEKIKCVTDKKYLNTKNFATGENLSYIFDKSIKGFLESGLNEMTP